METTTIQFSDDLIEEPFLRHRVKSCKKVNNSILFAGANNFTRKSSTICINLCPGDDDTCSVESEIDEAEPMEIHEDRAKAYEHQKNFIKALEEYEICYNLEPTIDNLQKLSELCYKTNDYKNACKWSEMLLSLTLKENNDNIFSLEETTTSTVLLCAKTIPFAQSLGKVLQNCITCLKTYGQETFDASYIDKAIAHTETAKALLKKEDDNIFEKATLITVVSQLPNLQKLKRQILLKSELDRLHRLADQVNSIFECRQQTLSQEEVQTNLQFWKQFTDIYEDKVQQLKQEEEGIMGNCDFEDPKYYDCPINYTAMQRPTVASDGHSYEHGTLNFLIRKHSAISPLSRERLDTNVMYPNRALRRGFLSHRKSLGSDSGGYSSRRSLR
ncbi:unnamed protein product [Moneuplotes crassus]|uniref:U-box domain-containing protein n=1 Tax=Euplotes crassus TaxID=5936 RepID=A0AAD1XBK4_EUPCR|nr:unnamed protein product [Moneuplotes crassus]